MLFTFCKKEHGVKKKPEVNALFSCAKQRKRRERERAEEQKVRQTSSRGRILRRNRMDLMGCDMKQTKKKCSKTETYKHRTRNNIAECRQMETPQRLWTVFLNVTIHTHTIFRTKFQSKQPTMLTISAGFIQTFPNRNQSKPRSVPSENKTTRLFFLVKLAENNQTNRNLFVISKPIVDFKNISLHTCSFEARIWMQSRSRKVTGDIFRKLYQKTHFNLLNMSRNNFKITF